MDTVLPTASIHYLSAPQLVGALLLGIAGVTQGIRHYRGTTTWLLRYLPYDAQFFLPLWVGALCLLVVLADLSMRLSRFLGFAFAIPAFALLVVAVLSIFWLPDRLLPAWYLAWREHGRNPAQLPGHSVMPGR